MKPLLLSLTLALAALSLAPRSTAAESPDAAKPAHQLPDEASAAWGEVQKALRPPAPPAEWNTRQPSEEEIATFRKDMSVAAGRAADLAREYFTRFPDDTNATAAREHHRRLLAAAVSLGDDARSAELEAAGGAPESVSASVPEDPLQTKLGEAARRAMAKQAEGKEAVFAEFERGVRELQKEYPDRPEIHAALLQAADGLPAEKALAIAREVEAAPTDPQLKQMAAGLRKKLSVIGQPITLAFTAIDDRKVDLVALRGKVVLVDFWATWCGPCIAELPNVLAAYEKLHPKGFEIVGISFDEDRDALEKFVKKRAMPWPQFFDGQGWQNKYGQEFGISSIPSMWLVDKKGVVRDLNAREDLVGKVERLLAEE